MTDRPALPSNWTQHPLLSTKGTQPASFVRLGWDEAVTTPFGPWRVSPRPDPLARSERHDLPRAELLPEPQTILDENAGLWTTHDPALVDHTSVREQIYAAAYAEGKAAGESIGAEAVRRSLAQEKSDDLSKNQRQLSAIITALKGLSDDPQQYIEPMKRLALHIAEQIVRGELRISGEVAHRLVQNCLIQLEHPADKARVHLHPHDADLLQSLHSDALKGLKIERDAELLSGSVRVSVNDSMIEDLIEHRLEALANQLLNHPDAWAAHSSLLSANQSERTVASPWAERVVESTEVDIDPLEVVAEDEEDLLPEALPVKTEAIPSTITGFAEPPSLSGLSDHDGL